MSKNLEHNVLKLHKNLTRKDELGEYIPFCTYHWHLGIIRDETKCLDYGCSHYKKFYYNPKCLLEDVK
jgi:hypothetical protein